MAEWDKITVTGVPNFGQIAKFSPDGAYCAVGHSDTPYLTVYDTSDWSKVVGTPTLNAACQYLDWNGDGTRLITSENNTLTVIDTSNWSVVTGTPGTNNYTGVAWSPDGAYVAAGLSSSPYLIVFDTSDWSTVSGTPTLAGFPTKLNFNADSTVLAIPHSITPFFTAVDTSDWSVIGSTPTLAGTGLDCDWSPDGSLVAVTHGGSPYVTVIETSGWTVDTGSPTLSGNAGRGVAFSPDSRHLTVGNDVTPYFKDYDPTDSYSEYTGLPTFTGTVKGIDYDPAQNYVAVALSVSPFFEVYEAPLQAGFTRKTFTFDADEEGFTFVSSDGAGGLGDATGTYISSTIDGEQGLLGPLMNTLGGVDEGYWEWTGTFEDLGVAPGNAVTGYSFASALWRQINSSGTAANVEQWGDADGSGAAIELIEDPSGTPTSRVLIANQPNFSAPALAWEPLSNDPAITGLSLASNTQIAIRIHHSIDMGTETLYRHMFSNVKITVSDVEPTGLIKRIDEQAFDSLNADESYAITIPASNDRITLVICSVDNYEFSGADPSTGVNVDLGGTAGTQIFTATSGQVGNRFAAFYWKDADIPAGATTLNIEWLATDLPAAQVATVAHAITYDGVDQTFGSLDFAQTSWTSGTGYTIAESTVGRGNVIVSGCRAGGLGMSGDPNFTLGGTTPRSFVLDSFRDIGNDGTAQAVTDSTTTTNDFRNELGTLYDTYGDWDVTFAGTSLGSNRRKWYIVLPTPVTPPDDLTTTVAATSTVTSNLNVARDMIAAPAATSTVTPALDVQPVSFAATVAATSTVVSDFRNTSVRYISTTTATSTVTSQGIVKNARFLASVSVTSVLGPTPSLDRQPGFVSTTTAASTITPSYQTGGILASDTIAVTSTVTAVLDRQPKFSTTVAATSTVAGDVRSITPLFASTTAATASVAPALSNGRPFIAAKTTYQSPGAGTQFTIPLPTHRAGQMLVVFLGHGDNNSPSWDTVGSTAGWRCERQGGNFFGTDVGGAWYFKLAESDSEVLVAENFTTEKFHAIAYAIDDADQYFIRSDNNGLTTGSQNPTFRPITFDKARTNLLSFVAVYGEADSIMTAAPTGYTIDETLQGGTSFNDGSVSVATKEIASASSETPDTATMLNFAAHNSTTFVVYKRESGETTFQKRWGFNDSTSYFDNGAPTDPRYIDNDWKVTNASTNGGFVPFIATNQDGPSGGDWFDDAFWCVLHSWSGTDLDGPDPGYMENVTTFEQLGLNAGDAILGFDVSSIWYEHNQVDSAGGIQARTGSATNGTVEIVTPYETVELIPATAFTDSVAPWTQLTGSAVNLTTPILGSDSVTIRIYSDATGDEITQPHHVKFEDFELNAEVVTSSNLTRLFSTSVTAASTVSGHAVRDTTRPEFVDYAITNDPSPTPGGTLAVTIPPHEVGDLLFVVLGGVAVEPSTANVASSAGWERLDHYRYYVMYKNIADTNSETFTFDLSPNVFNENIIAHAYVFRNVDNVTWGSRGGYDAIRYDKVLDAYKLTFAIDRTVGAIADEARNPFGGVIPLIPNTTTEAAIAAGYFYDTLGVANPPSGDTNTIYDEEGIPWAISDPTQYEHVNLAFFKEPRFRRIEWNWPRYEEASPNLDGWTANFDNVNTIVSDTDWNNRSTQLTSGWIGAAFDNTTGLERGYFEITVDPIADLGLTADDVITGYSNGWIRAWQNGRGFPQEGLLANAFGSFAVEVIDTATRGIIPNSTTEGDVGLAQVTPITGLAIPATQSLTVRVYIHLNAVIPFPSGLGQGNCVSFDRLRIDLDFTRSVELATVVSANLSLAPVFDRQPLLAGTLDATATITGNIDETRKLMSASAVTSVLGPTPTLAVARILIAPIDITSTVDANVGLTVFYDSTTSVVSTVNPNQFYYGFEAAIAATSTVTPTLDRQPAFSATVAATSAVTAQEWRDISREFSASISATSAVDQTAIERQVNWSSTTSVASAVFPSTPDVDRPFRTILNGFCVAVGIMDLKGVFRVQVFANSAVTPDLDRVRGIQSTTNVVSIVNGNIVQGLRFLTTVIAESAVVDPTTLFIDRNMITSIAATSFVDVSSLQRAIDFDTAIALASTVGAVLVVITNTLELTWSQTYFLEVAERELQLVTESFDDTAIINELDELTVNFVETGADVIITDTTDN